MRRTLNIFTLVIFTLNSCLSPLSANNVSIARQVEMLYAKADFKEVELQLAQNQDGAYVLDQVAVKDNFTRFLLCDGEQKIGTLTHANGCVKLSGDAEHSFVFSAADSLQTFEAKIGGHFSTHHALKSDYFIHISAPTIQLEKGITVDSGYVFLEGDSAVLGGNIAAQSVAFKEIQDLVFDKTARLDVGQLLTTTKVNTIRNLGTLNAEISHLEAHKFFNNGVMEINVAKIDTELLMNRGDVNVETMTLKAENVKNIKNVEVKNAKFDVKRTLNKGQMIVTDGLYFADGNAFVNAKEFIAYGYVQGKLSELINDGDMVVHGIAMLNADYGRLNGDMKARYASFRFAENLDIKGHITSSEHMTLHSDGDVSIMPAAVIAMQDYAWSDTDYGKHTHRLINAMPRGIFMSAKGDLIRNGDITSTHSSLTFTPGGAYIEGQGISRHGIFANNNMYVEAAKAELADKIDITQHVFVKAAVINLLGSETSREITVDTDELYLAKDLTLGALQGIVKNAKLSAHLKLSKHLNLKILNQFKATSSSRIEADIVAIDAKHSKLQGAIKAKKGVYIKGETCINRGTIDGGTKVDVDVTSGFENSYNAMVTAKQIEVNADTYFLNFLGGMAGDQVKINTTWNANIFGLVNGRKSFGINATALNLSLGVYQSNSYTSNSGVNLSPFGLVALSVPSDMKGFWDKDKAFYDQYVFRTGLSLGAQYATDAFELGLRAAQFALNGKDFIIAHMADDDDKEAEKDDDDKYRGSRIAQDAAQVLSLGFSAYQLYTSGQGLSDKWSALGSTEIPEKVLLWDSAKKSAATIFANYATERSLFSYKGQYSAYAFPSVSVKTVRGYDFGEHFTLNSSLYAADHMEVGGTKHTLGSFAVESANTLKIHQDFKSLAENTQLHGVKTDMSEGFAATGKKLSLKGVELDAVGLHELRTQTGKFENLNVEGEVAVEGHFDAKFDNSSEAASRSFKIKADTITVGEHVILTSRGQQKLESAEGDITLGAGSKIQSDVFTDLKAKGKIIGLHSKKVAANSRSGTDVTYKGAMILGGTGIDYVFNDPETGETSIRKLGMRLVADDTVDCTGVKFAADADISADAKNGFVNASDKEVHISNMHTSKKTLSTTYHDNYKTDFFTGAFDTPGKVVILSENGGFRQEAGLIRAQEGMYIITRDDIDLTSITGQQGVISRKKGRWALPNSSKANIAGLSLSSLLMSQGDSRIFVYSKEGVINAKGLLVANPEGSLALKAYKVILDRDVLDNQMTSSGFGISTDITGLQHLKSVSAVHNSKGTTQALSEGNLAGAFEAAAPVSAEVFTGYKKTTHNFQTLGGGSIDVSHVDIETDELVVGNGYGMTAKTGRIKAKKMTQTGAKLHNKIKTKSAGVFAKISTTDATIGLKATKSVTKATTHVPSVIQIGELDVEIDELTQTGGVINSSHMTGHIGTVNSVSQQDTSSTKHAGASVDIFGRTSAVAGFTRTRTTQTVSGINAGCGSAVKIDKANLHGAALSGVTADKTVVSSLPKDHKARGLTLGLAGHFEADQQGNVSHKLDAATIGVTAKGKTLSSTVDLRGSFSPAGDSSKTETETEAETEKTAETQQAIKPAQKEPSEKIYDVPPTPVITDLEKQKLDEAFQIQGPPVNTPSSLHENKLAPQKVDNDTQPVTDVALFVADQTAELSGVSAMKKAVKAADLGLHVKRELDQGNALLPAVGKGTLKTAVDAGIERAVMLGATAVGGPVAGLGATAAMAASGMMTDYSEAELTQAEEQIHVALKQNDLVAAHHSKVAHEQMEFVQALKTVSSAPGKVADYLSEALISSFDVPERPARQVHPEVQDMIDSGAWPTLSLIEKTAIEARLEGAPNVPNIAQHVMRK